MELLVDDAPDIGSDNKAFQNKVNKNKQFAFCFWIFHNVASNMMT